MKTTLYIIMIACYFAAAGMEIADKQWKACVLAFSFGIINAIIFLWKP